MMRALILTGRTLPGMDAQAVWGKVGAAFKLEPGDFEVRVLARTPLSIREVPDLAEAHRLQAGLQRCGAEAVLVDGDGSRWALRLDERVCGPVPFAYLQRCFESRDLPEDTQVMAQGTSEWTTLAEATGYTVPAPKLEVPQELDDEPPPLPPRNPIAYVAAPPAASGKSPPKTSGSFVFGLVAAIILAAFAYLLHRGGARNDDGTPEGLVGRGTVAVALAGIQSTSGGATVHGKITNRTNAFISHLFIKVPVFDAGGQLLGSGFFQISNLRQGADVIEEARIYDVSARAIASWKPSLDNIDLADTQGKELPHSNARGITLVLEQTTTPAQANTPVEPPPSAMTADEIRSCDSKASVYLRIATAKAPYIGTEAASTEAYGMMQKDLSPACLERTARRFAPNL